MPILNYLLAGALGYIVFFGMKDKEGPSVIIKFPQDGYEFRTSKSISVQAKDNKGVKSITYIIDENIYHKEDRRNPMKNVWNPCELGSGRHTLRVEASDHRGNSSTSEIVEFYISPDLKSDCHGTCDGKAVMDECGVCSGGETGIEFNANRDCNGDCFGGAIIDKCQKCSGGNTNLIENADLDCTGTCFGEAFLDECNVCSGGATQHEANSDKDCNGDCFGEAIIDDCEICSGGKTKHVINIDMDCNGDCFGEAYLDECEVCTGGNTNQIENSNRDCNGDCFGAAVTDPCGGCTGGNTGIEYNQSDVEFKNKSYTCGDLMFLIEMYTLKYPNNPCSSFNPTSNIVNTNEELSECIEEYLKIGETRWKNGRLIQYILSENNIKGQYPTGANYATELTYLDLSKNEFWGPFPNSLCEIHKKGTLRIAGNRFCPPYPDCFNDNAILLIDLEDMEKVAICK